MIHTEKARCPYKHKSTKTSRKAKRQAKKREHKFNRGDIKNENKSY